jgi:uncharacterized surface protein with fasciclin (FAS1) repeats
MRVLRTLFVSLTLFALSLGSAQTIVDVAAADERFSTLVTAVTAAGLVETLSGEGPFTVFAPTNDAFAALPEGALDAVLADPELLTAVLTYHVVSGAVRAADVVTLTKARTVQGEHLRIGTEGGVTVDDANVVITDLEASNGVIHVIDAVLLPKAVLAALGGRSLPTGFATYPLAAVGDSGVSGEVLIVDMGRGDTHVQIRLDGTPAGGDHPAHFHAGRCDQPGGVVIPLSNVDGDLGWSGTRLDVPFEWIVGGVHYVNVHLAPDQMGTSVACGDVVLD